MKIKKNIPLLIEIIYLLIIFSKNNIYTIVYAVWEKNVFTTTEFIEWVACLGVSWTVKITEYVFFSKIKIKKKEYYLLKTSSIWIWEYLMSSNLRWNSIMLIMVNNQRLLIKSLMLSRKNSFRLLKICLEVIVYVIQMIIISLICILLNKNKRVWT